VVQVARVDQEVQCLQVILRKSALAPQGAQEVLEVLEVQLALVGCQAGLVGQFLDRLRSEWLI